MHLGILYESVSLFLLSVPSDGKQITQHLNQKGRNAYRHSYGKSIENNQVYKMQYKCIVGTYLSISFLPYGQFALADKFCNNW